MLKFLKDVFSGRLVVELVDHSGQTVLLLRGSKESRRDVKDFHETSWQSLGAKGGNLWTFPMAISVIGVGVVFPDGT